MLTSTWRHFATLTMKLHLTITTSLVQSPPNIKEIVVWKILSCITSTVTHSMCRLVSISLEESMENYSAVWFCHGLSFMHVSSKVSNPVERFVGQLTFLFRSKFVMSDFKDRSFITNRYKYGNLDFFLTRWSWHHHHVFVFRLSTSLQPSLMLFWSSCFSLESLSQELVLDWKPCSPQK